MVDIILIILCYLVIGLLIGVAGGLALLFSKYEDKADDFVLTSCVLWPVLILIMVVKFIISIPKVIKEYVKFLVQLLIK